MFIKIRKLLKENWSIPYKSYSSKSLPELVECAFFANFEKFTIMHGGFGGSHTIYLCAFNNASTLQQLFELNRCKALNVL